MRMDNLSDMVQAYKKKELKNEIRYARKTKDKKKDMVQT